MAGEELLSITVGGDEGSARLDRVLAVHCGALSRSRLKTLILAGHAAIGATTVRDPAYHVAAGETITIAVPPPEPEEPVAEAMPLAIVYEDDAILVLDKPSGLVVHPAAGHHRGTLVNALIAHCGNHLSSIGAAERPGIVHRLDKDTTGLMVVAKTDRAHAALTRQFADHGRTGPLQRGYLAFVWGVPNRLRGTIDAPIDRHPRARERMAVREGGRQAVTHWETLEAYTAADGEPIAALIACLLDTGRTHQIRVHLAYIGHPVMGDAVYGPGFKTKAARLAPRARAALDALRRQALHARLLTLKHPDTGEVMSWEAPLPDDLLRLQAALLAAQ